jgi:hypothetical protein
MQSPLARPFLAALRLRRHCQEVPSWTLDAPEGAELAIKGDDWLVRKTRRCHHSSYENGVVTAVNLILIMHSKVAAAPWISGMHVAWPLRVLERISHVRFMFCQLGAAAAICCGRWNLHRPQA